MSPFYRLSRATMVLTNSFNADDYKKVVSASIQNIYPFKLHFQGITASPAGILAPGYPDGMSNLFRKNLRALFKKSGLKISFDTRYLIVAAHSTIIRFQNLYKTRQN